MNNIENYETDFINKNKLYYKNLSKYHSNEILNSMQESLDNFLLNLKNESNCNISKEELESYYLSKNDLFHSVNIDLISPYQNLLCQNIKRKNNNIRKNMTNRTYSAENLINKVNTSFINKNNLNKNNSFYDKNISNIKHNNSMLYNESDAINSMKKKIKMNISNNNSKSFNNISNISHKSYGVQTNSMKYFQNTKSDYPIKLINNNYMEKKETRKNNKKSKNILKIPRQNKSHSFIKQTNNNKSAYLNILRNIKNILIKIKNENNQNKTEIQNIYTFYNNFNEQIQKKLQMFINNYNNYLLEMQKEKTKYNNLMENFRSKEEELEEKNNKIFLLENDLNIKEEKIKQLLEQESEYIKTIFQFKKIMKDVKITVNNYEIMQEKQKELKTILNKFNLSNEELNNKTKELNEKNEKMKKDLVLIKTKKKSISKENEKNKSLVDLYKNNYETIFKEKEDLKKENMKLSNEIHIIKINNEKLNNIKVNNNFKLQNNLKLKETINNLTKEKQELETKYKNLQKESEENAKKNKNRSKSSINIFKQKKFHNLTKTKNKSFVIYNTSIIKEQNNRIYKKKKFNKLVIENKINLSFKQISIIRNKKSKINGYDYSKDINELKNKLEQNNKYICVLEKEKAELKSSNNIQINKLKETVKNLKETNEKLKEDKSNIENNNKLKEVIEQLEKDKNKINQAKIVETSQLRIEISQLKMRICDLNNELERYKDKEKNEDKDEFNIDDNEVHRLYI